MNPVRTPQQGDIENDQEAPVPAPRPRPTRGQQMGAAMRDAQDATRSNMNQAASASGYSRLVRVYDDMRKQSFLTNKVSGVLVSGASLTPRIQDDGSVQSQTADNYVDRFKGTEGDSIRRAAEGQVRSTDPEVKAEGLVKAVAAPLARAIHAANPELAPGVVRQNEMTRTAKEFIGMNEVSPIGDPSTGRPVFSQAWLASENGGQVPVYGFKKREGGATRYLGVLPGLDEKGNRTLSLVDSVAMAPGVNLNQTRHLIRTPHVAGVHPIETPEEQLALINSLRQQGWTPITQPPPEQADLPAKFRGLSEVNVTTRAVLTLADAVRRFDVINRGLQHSITNDPRTMDEIPPFEKGLVEDFSKQAMMLRAGAGLAPRAVETLYKQVSPIMQKLGALYDTVHNLRMDPAAMDPITDFRRIASDLLMSSNGDPKPLYRMLDNPEENFKKSVSPSVHRGFAAAENVRKAVLEQLAKDLTTALDAWPKPQGPQWVSADGKPLTFPDGSPRHSTPFDAALSRGGAHYDVVRGQYFDLVQSCMNASASLEAVQLLMAGRALSASRKDLALPPSEATRLATEHANSIIEGRPMANPQEEALVQRVLAEAGPTNRYLDEIIRNYVYAPLVAAHRASLSPAEFQRAMEANAKDNEPWSVSVKSYQVYSYNSVPVPSGPTVYIAPEQDLPKDYDPSDSAAVQEFAASKKRTWRVVRLEDEEGRPTPNLEEIGLSTKDMIAYRLKANEKNLPVSVSRKPLPENTPLSLGLAKTFNMPIVPGSDPIDGFPGRYATTGMMVTGVGIATTVVPTYYRALEFKKSPVVGEKEPIQLLDEAAFASNSGLARAKRAVEAEMKAKPALSETLRVLVDMESPEREQGVYVIEMTEAGLKAFEEARKSVIRSMGEAKIAMANHAFKVETRNLPPDQVAAKEAERKNLIDQAEKARKSKEVELRVLLKDMTAFMKANQDKVGYTGFAPALGVGNPAVRIHKPPMELRFPLGSNLEAMKARMNKHGLSVDLDQFRVE